MNENTEIVSKFSCPLCDKYASHSFCPVLRHIGQVHQFEPGFAITCGLDGCPNKYTSFYGYKTHLYRKHRAFVMLQNPAAVELQDGTVPTAPAESGNQDTRYVIFMYSTYIIDTNQVHTYAIYSTMSLA